MLWLSSKPLFLGLDIQANSIRGVEWSHSPGGERIVAYGSQVLPPGAMEGHQILQPPVLTEAIQQLIQKYHFKSSNVAIALPDNTVMSRILSLEKGLSEEEIEAYLTLEAESFIPFPVSELHLDFQILNAVSQDKLEVLLVTTRKSHLQPRIEALERAGLNVQSVDVESLVMERALKAIQEEQESGITALLNLGAHFSQFFVLHHSHRIFAREENYGWGNGDQERFTADLGLHIKRSLQFFFLTNQVHTVSKFFIMGQPAHTPHLISVLQEQFTFPLQIVNPFSQWVLDEKLQAPPHYSTYLLACALASGQGQS